MNQSSPVVTTPTALYCDQAIPEFLTANPAGGTWSGADLVNLTPGGQVTPIAGNIGVDTLFYTYINANGCVTVAQTIVTIQNETPAQAGNDVNACEGDPVIALAGAPAGGTWSGGAPWLSGNSFNPGGSGTFNLTYAQGSGSCATQDVRVITVTDTPNVVITGFTLCSNEPIYQLPNGVPAGGVWSGTGVSGAGPYNFDPAVGTQTLTYTVTVNNCTGSGSVLANVLPPPVANAGIDTTLCDQSIAFPLVGNYGNAGTWSGGGPYLTQNPSQFTPVPNAVGTVDAHVQLHARQLHRHRSSGDHGGATHHHRERGERHEHLYQRRQRSIGRGPCARELDADGLPQCCWCIRPGDCRCWCAYR